MHKGGALLAAALCSAGCAALAGLEGTFVVGDTMTSTVSSTGTGAAAGSGGSSAQGGSAGTGGGAGAEPWLEGYDARKGIRFEATRAQLDDFVAAVVIETDPDLVGAAQPNGEDIAFTAADGITPLSHEVELYNGTNGTLVAWVRIPSLLPQEPTFAYLYWGNPLASDQQDVHGTWADRYAGVWHLGENPATGLAAVFSDSSRSGNDGQLYDGLYQPARARGIAGGALQFPGNGAAITLGDPADGSLDFDLSSFSFSVWVYVDASAGPWDMPWFKGGSSIGNAGYDFELGASAWNVGVSDGTQIEVQAFGAETDFLGAWTHLVAVVDRSGSQLVPYANGSPQAPGDLSGFGSISTDIPASIGHATHVMQGRVDEVRIYSEALSSEWIDAEYRNLAEPASFYQVGPTELAP
ncbi:MAG: DUF2341 domain-containing protein [Deltaproteobacteria bacterium]|jgi:hypothetical protein|nr:DUF2341 domain-containing protein [Deltaproteobacteria bacterium]MBW2531705.1 DUF2341 domain-containing protein [Deltaproteobacteria bacterium]